MGYIYKIYNDFNDKVYVGKTTRSVELRFLEHFRQTSGGNSYIDASMAQHGIEHFKYQILEECENGQLSERERYWIAQLNCQAPNGYNLTSGGEGRPLSDQQLFEIRALWEQGTTICAISQQLNIPHSTVYHRVILYEDFDKEQNKKRAKASQYKPVTKYSQNGTKLQEYESLSAAAKDIGVKSSNISIGIKQGHLVNGYYFTYKDEPLITKTSKNKVMQFDLLGNYIQSFESARAAGRALKIDSTSIIRACNGTSAQSKGYLFLYEKDYDENILTQRIKNARSKEKYRKKEYRYDTNETTNSTIE